MTTPAERTRAVLDMERYVRDLWLYQDGKSSRALVPRYLITAIVACMRHYPSPYELGEAAKKEPHIFGDPR